MLPIRVCSKDRKTKVAVGVLPDSPSILLDVTSAAAKKLNISGSQLVLDNDGTLIDENIFLLHWCKEQFMLLEDNDTWSSATPEESRSSTPSENLNPNIGNDFKDSNSDNAAAEGNAANHDNAAPAKKAKNVNLVDLEHIEISWERFDLNTIEKLKTDCKSLNIKEKDIVVKQCVHYVVQQIREYTDHAPIRIFRSVAQEMYKKYPAVFGETLSSGDRLGTGYTNLVNKLTEHNRYLNRPLMVNSLHKKLKLPLKINKHLKAIQAGCTRWQPNFDTKEQEENVETKREMLLNFSNEDSVEFLDEMSNHLKESFPAQRIFLNQKSTPNAKDILDMWPCLFNQYFSHLHFLCLTGKCITDLRAQFNSDTERILMSKNMSSENMDTVTKNWHVISVIFDRFKDEIGSLFTIVDKDTAVNDIPVVHDYPHIIVFGEIPEKNVDDDDDEEKEVVPFQRRYSVVVDEMCYDFLNDVIDAIQLLMTTYFNFNRVYPKSCACFLEFVQRRFLNIYPLDGSRSKSQEIVSKVDRFIAKLQKIELD